MLNILPILHRLISRSAIATLLFLSGVSQAETWAITDQSIPLNAPSNARVIHLDDQQRLESMLSQALPGDPNLTPETIQRYLSSLTGKRLQNDLIEAQQGITDAWSLCIEKIPAVVVDRRYVIYGETDVAKAVERINQARGSLQ